MLTPDGTQLFNPVCRDCWSVPFKVQMYGWIKQTKTIIWQEERAYESKHLCGIPKMEGFEGSQGWLDKKKIHETLKSEKGIFMSEIYSTLFMIKVKHSQYIKQSLLLWKVQWAGFLTNEKNLKYLQQPSVEKWALRWVCCKGGTKSYL